MPSSSTSAISGASVLCPPRVPKVNLTTCNKNTQVCLSGTCESSICKKYGYDDCQLLASDGYNSGQMCEIRCRSPDSNGGCVNPCHVPQLRPVCGVRKEPGSACNNNNGYCDIFHKCRGINEEGPLSRLHGLLFNQSGIRMWIEFCQQQELKNVLKSISNASKDFLDVFFSAKTHKPEMPFRVILSERGTWQKALGLFLQEKLKLLDIEDPFLVKNSEGVLDFARSQSEGKLYAFSVDIKDLYYSLPHDMLISCVEANIDRFGIVAFQNTAGLSASGFVQLLIMYLKSTYIHWDGKPFLQKKGVCIGSCIAPVLSDLLLADVDKSMSSILHSEGVIKTFRFVDDYLLVIRGNVTNPESQALNTISKVQTFLSPLELTHELPVNSSIKFLDITLTFNQDHMCWAYCPRANKPLLPYESAHSKLVKRGIVKYCLRNVLQKSCPHQMAECLQRQTERLHRAGYPTHVVVSVAEALLRQIRAHGPNQLTAPDPDRGRVVVIPYLHNISHRLKKIGERAGARAVFSAPEKLSKLITFAEYLGYMPSIAKTCVFVSQPTREREHRPPSAKGSRSQGRHIPAKFVLLRVSSHLVTPDATS
ncbi:uncharacterized protein LOC135379006 [Ornithodoros turicata]|uniref:uncharacterized protein LOC135379006 n=1 Tax=Ornithodoros turicata TaxID=34597 RepID=UPI0031393D61